MKLIRENVYSDDIKLLVEETDNGKKYKINGIFMQSEVENQNGRIYKRPLIEREVDRYKREKILTNSAVGELDHPKGPHINVERISHIVEDMYMDGDNAVGKARILDTTMGRIVKTLLSENIRVGVSSRGVGNVAGKYVKDDFKLLAIDVVNDPSAPDAFVEGILENKEYIIKDNRIVEIGFDNFKKSLDKKYSKEDLMENLNKFFKNITENYRV